MTHTTEPSAASDPRPSTEDLLGTGTRERPGSAQERPAERPGTGPEHEDAAQERPDTGRESGQPAGNRALAERSLAEGAGGGTGTAATSADSARTGDASAAKTQDTATKTEDSTAEDAKAGDTKAGDAKSASGEKMTSLVSTQDGERFRTQWNEIQVRFVDDPKAAVQDADGLVAEVMQTLARTFASNKSELEGQWRREGKADTEDLRMALQHYRSFFNRLIGA